MLRDNMCEQISYMSKPATSCLLFKTQLVLLHLSVDRRHVGDFDQDKLDLLDEVSHAVLLLAVSPFVRSSMSKL